MPYPYLCWLANRFQEELAPGIILGVAWKQAIDLFQIRFGSNLIVESSRSSISS